MAVVMTAAGLALNTDYNIYALNNIQYNNMCSCRPIRSTSYILCIICCLLYTDHKTRRHESTNDCNVGTYIKLSGINLAVLLRKYYFYTQRHLCIRQIQHFCPISYSYIFILV